MSEAKSGVAVTFVRSRMSVRSSGLQRLLASHPEDRKAQDQQDQEDHDEDIEQEAGDIRRCGRYAGEAENAGNDRDQKEKQRPSKNCHRPLLKRFAAETAARSKPLI